jgi:hypothetical protein
MQAMTPALIVILMLLSSTAYARWKPEYAQLDPKVQHFLETLHNKQGESCCANADGYRPNEEDIEWDTKANRYRVKIEGNWIDVPDFAKLDDQNITGRAIVWSYHHFDPMTRQFTNEIKIRCFLPGAEL